MQSKLSVFQVKTVVNDKQTLFEFFGFVQADLQILSFLEVSDWDDLALRHSSPKATYLEKKSMSKMRRKWSDLIISLLDLILLYWNRNKGRI